MKLSKFRNWNENMFRKHGNLAYYHHRNPFIQFVERKRAKVILEQLNLAEKNKNILDLGCGDGYLLEKLHDNSVGLDISFTAIKNIEKRLVNKKIVIGDAECLPFKTGSLNKIVCSEVLEHVETPDKVLNEIDRIISNKGEIVLTIPNEPLINKLKSVLGQKPYEWHLHTFDLNLFKELIDKSKKFKITNIKEIPFFFLPIRYVIKMQPIRD